MQHGAALTGLPTPSQCRLWRDPQATLGQKMDAVFELADTFCEESHWWRYLLVCRDCGQHYLFEFYEEIDWAAGKDGIYTTYLPVTGAASARALHRETAAGMLSRHAPALIADSPLGSSELPPRWVRP